jgi:hypothetical protein
MITRRQALWGIGVAATATAIPAGEAGTELVQGAAAVTPTRLVHVIKLPFGYSLADRDAALQIAKQSLRPGEFALVLAPGWDYHQAVAKFIDGKWTVEVNLPNEVSPPDNMTGMDLAYTEAGKVRP